MKRLYILFVILNLALTAAAQDVSSFYERHDFLRTSPAVFQEGELGLANPANLNFLKNPEILLGWTLDKDGKKGFQDWSLIGGLHGLGFGMIHRGPADYSLNSYQISLGFGDKSSAFGIGYNWNTGNKDELGYENLLTFSAISRSDKILSIGLIYSLSMESRWSEGFAEIGIRPLKSSLVTLFADAALERYQVFSDAPWSAGFVVEPADGINLIGRYFENKSFTLAINIGLGTSSLSAQPYYDNNQKLSKYSFSIRSGGLRPSVINESIDRGKKYVSFNLKGTVGYNKYSFFDSGKLRFMDILSDIGAAIDDSRVAVIALNLSGLRIYPEHAWEIREELKRARQAGKKVIIFVDDASMTQYHLASIADKIVMDPSGSLRLPGFAMGRTYLKGTLDKLGIGFDPWRFQKYKSAPEGYSRTHMSEAAREQNQDYVDDRYELVRDDVCSERNLTSAQYDKLIDETSYFTPTAALEAGLVDTLARWSELSKIIKNITGSHLKGIARRNLKCNAIPQRNWGEPDKIALIYGVGDCEMDRGIRARWLEYLFLRLAKDKSIKAVVFRVDSPGGLMMPSDMVARAVKRCAKEKPLIVSMGQVAASGGYMISAWADSILAGPNSLTGSIGVYGGWLYDNGFGGKIGMSSDLVKRGEHADLGYGIRLPLLGLQIPARNLTEDEYGKMKKIINQNYQEFVADMAEARGKTGDEMEAIAQGRIYSGTEAQNNGLIDDIGGLKAAIDMARKMAGIDCDAEINLIEIPKSKGIFNLENKFNPLGISTETDPVYDYLKIITENLWRPVPMLEPGLYPELE